MSDPAPSAAPRDVAPSTPSPPAPQRAPRPARWLDRLSVLLLVAAAAVVIGVATPSLLRTVGLQLVVRGDPETAPPATASPHRALPTAARPTLPEDDFPHITEPERLFPDGMRPGQLPPQARDSAPASKPRVAHPLAPLTLRERADPTAPVTGHVPAGVRLIVAGESDDWARVVWQSPDGLLIGWTKRAALTAP